MVISALPPPSSDPRADSKSSSGTEMRVPCWASRGAPPCGSDAPRAYDPLVDLDDPCDPPLVEVPPPLDEEFVDDELDEPSDDVLDFESDVPAFDSEVPAFESDAAVDFSPDSLLRAFFRASDG